MADRFIQGPTTPYASVQHGAFKHVGYTGVYNIVDYSSVSFPCGVTADKAKDTIPSNYTPLSPTCKEIHDDCELTTKVSISPTNFRQINRSWSTAYPSVYN